MNLQVSSHSELRSPDNVDESQPYFEDFESACSTPYVSAPSSPGRSSFSSAVVSGGFFYSAPASPIHFSLTSNSVTSFTKDDNTVPMGFEFEFEFSGRFGSAGPVHAGSMSSADELFLNGKIRPMKLSTHLERPQVLAPLMDLESEEDGDGVRGRDLRTRDKSARRRTRSMSPMRRSNPSFEWIDSEIEQGNDRNRRHSNTPVIKEENEDDEDGNVGLKLTANSSSSSSSSSRSSSAGRNSKRWLFLKEFLRSKSEGRSNTKYFWSNISFSPAGTKEKKPVPPAASSRDDAGAKTAGMGSGTRPKPANGVMEKNKKKKTYELHYTANRAQAEEMRKKTFLPYRQGLLGCLGFSSKGYGAVNGLARALNPVPSR